MKGCWLSSLGPAKTADGSYLTVQSFKCPKALLCLDKFSDTMFLKETERMSDVGLVTDANPLGSKLMVEWLKENCEHPQKTGIIKHIASLPPLGVVIPHSVLKLIGEKT